MNPLRATTPLFRDVLLVLAIGIGIAAALVHWWSA